MGVKEGYSQTLASAQVDGPSRSTFTTAISILPAHARHNIDPDSWYIGRTLHIWASGRISNVVTAQPTFTFEVRSGPTSNIVAWSSGAILTSTTAHTTVPWIFECYLTCRAIGDAALTTLWGQGSVLSRAFIDSGATADITTLGHPSLLVPETTPAIGTGFDCNVANIFDLFAACSVSNAANLIQLRQYVLRDI